MKKERRFVNWMKNHAEAICNVGIVVSAGVVSGLFCAASYKLGVYNGCTGTLGVVEKALGPEAAGNVLGYINEQISKQ